MTDVELQLKKQMLLLEYTTNRFLSFARARQIQNEIRPIIKEQFRRKRMGLRT
jgi:hypothetical protein